MAENRNLHVQLNIDANTKKAQSELQQLSQTLSKLSVLPSIKVDDDQIKKASAAAKELQQHLSNAVNVNTGKLDLNKFTSSLNQSNKSLKDYKKDLEAIGPEGRQAFLQLSSSIASADAPLITANTHLQEFLGTLKNTARWQISSSILHGFMGAIQSAMGYAKDLNESLNNIQIVTQHSSDYMADFAQQANKAAKELHTSTTAYTDAALIYYQQGLKDSEVQKRAEITIKMANATGRAAQEVSSQLTAVWNNFAEGSENLEHYADVMAALGAKTASSSSEIADGLQKFAAIGDTVGLSYEYAASALATITATTRESADTVGNALKTLFARIQGLKLGDTLEDGVNLNKYSAALKQVGVDVLDINGELRNMDDILDDLGPRWQELGREQQTALAQTVAGVRQYAQFMTLMNNWNFFKENVNTSNNSDGYLEKQAEIYANSWKAARADVQASLQGIYDTLIDEKFFITFDKGLAKALDGVNGLLKGLGGIPGILATIGSFITGALAKEAPAALEKITSSISIIAGSGQNSVKTMLADLQEATNNMPRTDSSAYDMEIEKINVIANMKQQLAEKSATLSDAEREAYENSIRTAEAQYDVAIAYGKAADEAAKKVENIKADIVAASDEKVYVNSQIETLERYIKTIEEMRVVKESVTQKANSWQSEGIEVDELRNRIRDYLEQLKEIESVDLTDEGWQKLLEDLNKTDISAEDLYNDLKAIGNENFRINISDSNGNEAINSLEGWKSIIEDIKKELQELDVTSPSLEKLDVAIKKSVKSTREFSDSSKKAGESAKDLGDHVVKPAEQLAKISSALMSVTALLSSMKRLSDVFSDKDATILEKITGIIGLFVTLTRTAKTVSEALSVTIGVQTAAHTANAAAEGAETVAATGLSAVNGKLALSFGALQASIPVVGAILVGITAAITAATMAIGAHNKKIEEEIEKEKKRAEQAKITHESLKAEAEANETLVQSYKEALKAWQTTGTGRDALVSATKAVCEAYDVENSSLLLLTGQYDELTKAIYRKRDASLEDLKTSIREDKEYAERDFVSGISGSENIETHDNEQYYHILSDGTRITQEVFDQQTENWEKVLETAEKGSEEYAEAVQKLNELWYSSTEYGRDTLLRFKDNFDGYDKYAEKTQEVVDKVIAANEDIKLSISDSFNSRGDLFLNLGEIDADNAAESYKAAYDQVLEIKKAIQEVYDGDMSYLDSGIWKSIQAFIQENEENYNRLKELEEEYQTVDLSEKMKDTTQAYIEELGHDIESFEEYEALIGKLKETLTKAGVKDKDLDEMIKKYWSGYSTYADFATEAEAVQQKVESAVSSAWDKDRIQNFYESLTTEQKEFFLYLDFDEDVSEENLLEEVNHLKEVADREENKVLIQSQYSGAQDNFGYKSGMNFSELMNWKESSGIVWDTHITVTGREEAEDAIISWEEFISADEAKQQQMLHDYSSSISIVNSEDLDQQLTEANQILDEKRSDLREKFKEYGGTNLSALTDEQAAEIEALKQEVVKAEEEVKTAEDNIATNTAITAAKIKSSIKELKDSQFKAGDIIDLDTYNALTQDEGLGLNLDNIVIKSENGQITVKDPDALNKQIKEALIDQVISKKLDIPIQSLITSTKDLELIPPEWIEANDELYQIIVKNVNAQEIWGIKIRDFNSVVKQSQNDSAKFSEVWEKAQNNIKSISAGEAISGFYKVLTEGGDAAEWLYKNLSKVKITGDESTGTLLTLKAVVEKAGGDWTVISNQIDLTGKSLEQLKSLSEDKIINEEQYDKAAAALAKTTDSIDELREIFREGNVDADGFASNVERLFKAGDISLNQAIQEIWNSVDGVKFTSQDAHKAIDQLLNNNSVTTQQKIEQLNKLISEGKANAKEYSEYIQALLGSEDMTSQQKLSELGNKEYKNGYGLTNKYSAQDRYAGYSQLSQDESLNIEDRRKALEGMKQAMDELGESAIRTREYAESVMKVSQDTGDTAEETASKLFDAFGGADMDPDNWITFGNMIETLLGDMEGDAETKMAAINKLLEGTKLSLEQLGINFKSFGELDLSGKSLTELRSKNEYKEDAGYEKAVEDALKLETSIYNVSAALQVGQINSEQFTEKVKELFNSGDATLEQAVTAIYVKLDSGKITAKEASDAINELLNQSSVTTEEKLEQINRKINEGKATAEDYATKLKLIMEDDSLTSFEKFNQISSEENYTDQDKISAYNELLKDTNLSLAQRNQIQEEAITIFSNLKTSEDGLSDAKIAEQAKELTEELSKTDATAEEVIPKILEFFSGADGTISENNIGAAVSLVQTFFDDLGGDPVQNFERLKELFAQFGVDLEAAGWNAENFSEKLKEFSFNIDEFGSFAENMNNLNRAFENTGDINSYVESVKKLVENSTDLGLTTEQARIAALAHTATLLQQNGVLDKNLKLFTEEIETVNDLYQVLDILEAAELKSEKIEKVKQQTLLKLGSQYKECSKEVNVYKQALGSNDKQQQEAARRELELATRCAETAEQYGYNYNAMKTLAQSYKEFIEASRDSVDWLEEESAAMVDVEELAASLAERYIRVNDAIADLEQNQESYTTLLDSMSEAWTASGQSAESLNDFLIDEADQFGKLQEAVAGALNMTDAYNVSAEFMAENGELIKQVMEGDEKALIALQEAFTQDVVAHIDLDDSEFQNKFNMSREELTDFLNNIEPGVIDLDANPFLQTLATLWEQSGLTTEQIRENFRGMGIDVEFADDVADIEDSMNEIATASEQAAQRIESSHLEAANGTVSGWEQAEKLNVKTMNEGANAMVDAGKVETIVEDSQDTDVENQEGIGWRATPTPVNYQVQIPTYHAETWSTGFAVTGGIQTQNLQYSDISVEPDKKTESATKETKTRGVRLKSATKTAGGISHKNVTGGNHKSSSGNNNSGKPSRSKPAASKPTTVSAPDMPIITEKTHDTEQHEEKTHDEKTFEKKNHDEIVPEVDYLEDYIKQNPERVIAQITEDKDEVYTNRRTFFNERYDKEKKADVKEFERKDSSMFLSLSEEIDQYHDINNTLEKIGYKLDEINQRKSRAFGKAHIDAINEEGLALKEQLAAQEEYISQLATRRSDLQKQLEGQGWKFDENGSISNYIEGETNRILDFNSTMERSVEENNRYIQQWNDDTANNTQILNDKNKAIKDTFNAEMSALAEETNSKIEEADNIKNAKDKATTLNFNNTKEALAATKQTNDEAATLKYNEMITAEVEKAKAARAANVASREKRHTENEKKRETALAANIAERNAALNKAEGKSLSEKEIGEILKDEKGMNKYLEQDGNYKGKMDVLDAWKNSAQNQNEAWREEQLKKAKKEYEEAIKGKTGEFADEEVAKKNKAIIEAAKKKYEAAEKQIENEYNNKDKEIENTYKNKEKAITAKYEKEKNEAENKFQNKEKAIENDYELEDKQIENDYKNEDKRINQVLEQAKKTGLNTLNAKLQQNKEEYQVGLQAAEHKYKSDMAAHEKEHETALREIYAEDERKQHEIKMKRQDAEEEAATFYENRQTAIDEAYASEKELNDLEREQAKQRSDSIKKMVEELDSTEDTIDEAMIYAQDLRNKIYDNALEVIDYTLNLKIQLSNNVMQALTALLDSLGNTADRATDRIAILGQQMSQFKLQVSATHNAIYDLINSQKSMDSAMLNRFMNGTFTDDDLAKSFNIDEFTADKVEKLQTYRDNLISLISSQRQLKEQMFSVVNEAFSEYQTSLNGQIEKIVSLTKFTQTYQNIIGIVGKKVLDASGVLSETLSKAAFTTQRDQTRTYKSILDEIESNIADMKYQQKAFAPDSDMYKDWQKQIDEMESQKQAAEANWLSSWQQEMQAAADYYADAIDTIIMHFDKGISGLIGSLDLLSKEYNRQKEIQDVYVEDYEKIYQLSKLTRDVQNAIDDSDHIKNKTKLKKLQEEINAANADGVKMSQYDLDVLRKKFELELARDELEESRNAKSQVRMMRDAEGNYGYVYTADANAVADAEEKYEDKLHELQVLNTNYIKQLESNYMQLQQNVRDEIASLDITQFATEEEYLAEVNRIQSAAIEMQERLSQQMGNAFGNNRDLYENEWTQYSQMTGYKISADEDYLDKFNETTYSVLTGFKSMQEAKDQFTTSLADAMAQAIQAYIDTQDMQKIAMGDGETSWDKFDETVIQKTDEVVKETEKIADSAEQMSQTYRDAFGEIADSAGIFAKNYVTAIQPIIDSNLQLLDTIAQIIEYQANTQGTSGDGSGSGGVASGVKSSGTTWDAFVDANTTFGTTSGIGEYLPFIAALLQFGGYQTEYGGWGTVEERRAKLKEVFGDGADEDVNKFLSEHMATDLGSYWLSIVNDPTPYTYEEMKKKIKKFDTGGYTGAWNSIDGKFALLHEKELVLNKEDTDNILQAVDMVRKITQMIDLNALSASSFMGDILSAATINNTGNEVLQQEVHITAEFPNATDRDEIIEAFDNLTNLAMQYAGKQNYV